MLIPAYNEEKYISQTIAGTKKISDMILVVDDGSADNTAKLAAEAGVVVIRHPKNQGKGRAKQTGFDWILEKDFYRDFDLVITMDADGQHDPEDLLKFLEAWQKTRADVIVGNRMANAENMPFVRYWTNRIMSLINSFLAGQKLPDSQCDYRLISRQVLEKIRITGSGFEADAEFLFQTARCGFHVGFIPIKTIYVPGRESKIKPMRDTLRYFRLLKKEILIKWRKLFK